MLTLLQVLLEGESVEAAMLARLGFEAEIAPAGGAPPASDQIEAATAALQAAHLTAEDGDAAADFFDRPPGASPRGGSGTALGGEDGDDFFNKLAEQKETATLRSHQSTAVSDSGVLEGITGDVGANEAEIQRYLFVGNHAAAVEACISAERYADALVVAHVSGAGDLWRSALAKYMRACPHPYLRVIDSQVRSAELVAIPSDWLLLCLP